MILTDYYKFERLATKSKLRMDCTASTESYQEFEDRRATKSNRATEKRDATDIGSLVIYFGNVPDNFGGNVHRKADKSLTIKGKNISSIYVPNIEICMGFGDFRETTDALLFLFSNDYTANNTPPRVIEVFVARGQKNNRNALYNLLSDGQLDDEIEALRKRAVTNSVTQQ